MACPWRQTFDLEKIDADDYNQAIVFNCLGDDCDMKRTLHGLET